MSNKKIDIKYYISKIKKGKNVLSELFILHLDNADKELYTKLLKVISESDCRIHKIS